MWHALLHLAANRPRLLAAHASAYTELVGAESARVSASWRRRLLFDAAALLAAGVAVMLAGVAILLWAALPTLHLPWLAAAVPLVPLVLAAVCVGCGRREVATFEPVWQQLRADLAMLAEGEGR